MIILEAESTCFIFDQVRIRNCMENNNNFWYGIETKLRYSKYPVSSKFEFLKAIIAITMAYSYIVFSMFQALLWEISHVLTDIIGQSKRWGWLEPLFSRWRNWAMEILSDLPKTTLTMSVRPRIWTQTLWLQDKWPCSSQHITFQL